MAHGHYQGKDARDPEIRALFTREALLASDWYKERLRVKQERDVELWTHVCDQPVKLPPPPAPRPQPPAPPKK